MFPLLRVAFVIVNLTTGKQVAGIATCLAMADVQNVASKQSAANTNEDEGTLQHAVEIVRGLKPYA